MQRVNRGRRIEHTRSRGIACDYKLFVRERGFKVHDLRVLASGCPHFEMIQKGDRGVLPAKQDTQKRVLTSVQFDRSVLLVWRKGVASFLEELLPIVVKG